MSESMNLNFTYRTTYANGKKCDTRKTGTIGVCKVSRSEYIEVAKYIAAGGDLNASDLNSTLSGVAARMKAHVAEYDVYYTLTGQFHEKPLKTPREITNIEVWIYDYDLKRFQRMKDIDAVFARPEQSMVLTRYDGSTVTVTVKDGLAEIQDSRKRSQHLMMEEEQLADRLSR